MLGRQARQHMQTHSIVLAHMLAAIQPQWPCNEQCHIACTRHPPTPQLDPFRINTPKSCHGLLACSSSCCACRCISACRSWCIITLVFSSSLARSAAVSTARSKLMYKNFRDSNPLLWRACSECHRVLDLWWWFKG